MRKLVICLLAIALLFSLNFQASAGEKKSLEEYFFQIKAVEGNISMGEAYEFAELIANASPAEAIKFVKAVMAQEKIGTEISPDICNALSQYGWILQVIHDVLLGKAIPYQSCAWYLYSFLEETLLWCPSTCQCNLNAWCAFHQYQRIMAAIGLLNCTG
ncbi:MAG: hypothetical protein NTZ97_04185 [Candidatus Moranbacteria bacterium]|nr:hypothetical protein [Candidatus Moranbacteria bacterium]